MKVEIKFPADFFGPTITDLQEKGLVEEGNSIGNVYVVGDWEGWGGSTEKPGCIKPSKASQMVLDDRGDWYVAAFDLTVGLHLCKPVIVSAEAEQSGMAAAIWIPCPPNGFGNFKPQGGHANWAFTVK